MSKVSAKTDQALSSSSSSSLLPVSPGTAISGTAAVQSHATRRPPNRQGSFNAHLKTAHDEQASGSQSDRTDSHDAAAHVSKTASKGPTDSPARHSATQNTAQPSATDTVSAPTIQTVDSTIDPSASSRAKKATSGSDTSTSNATQADLTTQSQLTDILSQVIGIQQNLPSLASQGQDGAAGYADVSATANPAPLPSTTAEIAIQQAPTASSVLQADIVAPSGPTTTGQRTFATVLAQLPGGQQAIAPALSQPAANTTAAAGQNTPSAAATPTPDSTQILAGAASQPAAGTISTSGQNTPATASGQVPNSQHVLVSVSSQPGPTTDQNDSTVISTLTPGSTQILASTLALSPTDGTSGVDQAGGTGTAPTIVVAQSTSALAQSSFPTTANAAKDESRASQDAPSALQDTETATTASAASTSAPSARQITSANQTDQRRGSPLTAPSLSTDNPASPTSGLTPLSDGTNDSAAQSGAHGGTMGHSDSANGNQEKASSQADLQMTTGLNLPAGISLSSSFAGTLNDVASTTHAEQTQKAAGASHGTDGQTVSPSIMTQSAGGSTSLSMTILTEDSTPVHVRVEGTDGLTTGVVLQSEDLGTARHLADNRHELVAALTAAGVDVSNLKIDVVAASSNNGDFQNQGQNQNADGTAYNSNFSGNMSGGGSGQNGQQTYGGSIWSTNSVVAGPATGDAEAQNGSHSVRSSGPYAGSGINITA